jgi:hypothetical protein
MPVKPKEAMKIQATAKGAIGWLGFSGGRVTVMALSRSHPEIPQGEG